MKKLAQELIETELSQEVKELIASQKPLPDPITEVIPEPQILFLGTASMKPGSYRGATAIHVFNKRCGFLMDTAEGTYG